MDKLNNLLWDTACMCRGDITCLERLRCVVTTYCLCADISVDTYEWDTLIDHLHVVCGYSREQLDGYMCEYLV